MKLVLGLTIAAALLPTTAARADCVCRCVDGQMQPLCESSIEVTPICAATICTLPLPSVKPIEPPAVPPVGATKCFPRQVLDPGTGQYEWRTLCR